MDSFVADVVTNAPWYLTMGFARLVPAAVIRRLVMKRMARQPDGPLRWVEADDRSKVQAFFVARSHWQQIPGWEESTPNRALARSAAPFRGGECLAECAAPPWNCDEIAAVNPYFAQVWPAP